LEFYIYFLSSSGVKENNSHFSDGKSEIGVLEMNRKVLVMGGIVLEQRKASELIHGASWYCLLTNLRRYGSWCFLASYFFP